jgi:catechol 2,3-dioxygenase-like lactoylglutathione lyase family enzyme
MSQTAISIQQQKYDVSAVRVAMNLEVDVISVSDVERSKQFYRHLGWRLDASEIWHGAPFPPEARLSGPDPKRTSYGSFFSFNDPDGNTWLVQEVTTRHPGRIDPATTTFASANDLASAMRRAAAAHGGHEKRDGQRDANWPDWYAAYMAASRQGPSCRCERLCACKH